MLALTPEEKQEIKARYLKDNPKPAYYGMGDESGLMLTLIDMNYVPPMDYVNKVIAPYKDGGPKTPEIEEMLNLWQSGRELFKELFPDGRGARAERARARRQENA